MAKTYRISVVHDHKTSTYSLFVENIVTKGAGPVSYSDLSAKDLRKELHKYNFQDVVIDPKTRSELAKLGHVFN